MCVPGLRSFPLNRGVEEVVAVMIISASWMACLGFEPRLTVGAFFQVVISSASFCAADSERSKRLTSVMEATAITPCNCARPCTPAPKRAIFVALRRANSSAARPPVAPVRIAVRASPSISALGIPVCGSRTITEAVVVGKPRLGLSL
ncbi:hypothetical protein ES703_41404 [subsurface metagenome]